MGVRRTKADLFSRAKIRVVTIRGMGTQRLVGVHTARRLVIRVLRIEKSERLQDGIETLHIHGRRTRVKKYPSRLFTVVRDESEY